MQASDESPFIYDENFLGGVTESMLNDIFSLFSVPFLKQREESVDVSLMLNMTEIFALNMTNQGKAYLL